MSKDNDKYGFGETKYDKLEPICSVTFGDGSICVTDVTVDGCGFSGVSFSDDVENRGVGADLTDLVSGQLGDNITPKLLLRFDNPKSIDVVIAKLELAKLHLNKEK